jgi:hypothetical protein
VFPGLSGVKNGSRKIQRTAARRDVEGKRRGGILDGNEKRKRAESPV